ncbi:MAG: hypothetical protein GX261_06815 [Spirochaetales bacterium]|nr:hypothetical protein [Spirochaetales bacterium]
MNKRAVVFVCLLVFAVGGVMAYDNMTTVGLDYSALVYPDKDPINFTGVHAGFYSYPDQFSASGFYVQASAQTMVADNQSNWFTTYLMNVLLGYSHRIGVGKMFDLVVGGGPSYQMLSMETKTLLGTVTTTASMIGFGASVEVNFLLSPKMTINGGLSILAGIYDLHDKKVQEEIPATARTYIGVGFCF